MTNNMQTTQQITEIYERNCDTVYRICFMYMKNKYDANDIVQATFLSLLQSEVAFESENKEKAWLIVTASNHCKNSLKHWWRKKTVGINQLAEIPAAEDIKSESLDLILDLPSKYKHIIYLYYYEDYKTEEIANMLQMNPSTVRTRLSRARQLLKTTIEEENYG